METNKQFRAVASRDIIGTKDLISKPVSSSQEASNILKEYFKSYPASFGAVEKWNPETKTWEIFINERKVL